MFRRSARSCAARLRPLVGVACSVVAKKAIGSQYVTSASSKATDGMYRGMRQVLCFFFQAEDGIRDYKVTGVQTCALPISRDGGQGDSATVVHTHVVSSHAVFPSTSAESPCPPSRASPPPTRPATRQTSGRTDRKSVV